MHFHGYETCRIGRILLHEIERQADVGFPVKKINPFSALP